MSFSCLQAFRYWAEACTIFERPDLITDERFATQPALAENSGLASQEVRSIIGARTAAEWRERLEPFSGQWIIAQDILEAAADPQSVANGYVVDSETAGGIPFKLAAAPVQFDETPPTTSRAPEFNEHGDDILAGLGLSEEDIIDLKIRGVVA